MVWTDRSGVSLVRCGLAGGVLGIGLAVAHTAWAMDHVVLRQADKQVKVMGRVLVAAQDGGLMLLARDGTIWIIQPNELLEHTEDDVPFKPFTPDEVAEKLLQTLPNGFELHRTSHYLILHNTSREYASWCGSLFERLYMAFTNFWTRRGFDLHEPEIPLIGVIWSEQRAYEQFARGELGDAVSSIIGYYSLQTNRMTLFDLTGMAGLGRGSRGSTAAQINRILAQPEAERMVATLIHEATHQIAFNCGLHTRYSDCPLWVSEGIAVYFETPDLTSVKGWSTIGAVNRPRLARFLEYLPKRPADSLSTLIRDDKRFRDTSLAQDAYAEAWALTYYLLRHRPKQYLAYLKVLSAKQPARADPPEVRLRQFREAFGDDLEKLDAELKRYVLRLR